MSYTTVGTCPRCGAPIYAPYMWHSILPPPSTPSCNCFPERTTTTTTTTKFSINDTPVYDND